MSKEKNNKLFDIYKKHKEVILYLIFGVLTTFVGWAVYFAILLSGKSIFGIAVEDTSSARFMAVYTAAQIIQWIAAVLFAFFTNKKYVFDGADKQKGTLRQLIVFAGGRLATFGVDYLVTWLGAIALSKLLPSLCSVAFIGREWNLNEIAAKFVAAVIVVVSNYFISKFLVFKNKDK